MPSETLARGAEGNELLIKTLEEILAGLKSGERPWFVLLYPHEDKIGLASNVDEAPQELQARMASAMQGYGDELNKTGW